MVSNLTMFDVLDDGKELAKQLVKKTETIEKATTKRGGLISKIESIRSAVTDNLGKYKDQYTVITTEFELFQYVSDCLIYDTEIAIDTETTGLDPMQDDIVGLCLYSPGSKPAYVPINHVDYMTGERLPNQLDKADVTDCLTKLKGYETNIIMHNAKFDIRVIRNQLGVDLECYWDTLLAARLLNENEPSNALKKLHQKYVLDDAEDEFRFDELFKGVTFDKVPIEIAYLYAAHDAIITYELYEFQKEFLNPNSDRKDMADLYWVFRNIEMPCVSVVADMEDTGVLFDKKYAEQLSKKYHKLLDEKLEQFYSLCDEKKINAYKSAHPNVKLDNPINVGSPTQMAVLIYDILKLKSPDKKNPRGTGVDVLERIDHPVCKAILDYREIQKLLSAFIDSLPEMVNPNDGRVHCSFNQYGAKTGRLSCSDPNLMQIPAKNKEIRQLFIAEKGNVLISSDFKAQEPKTLAAMCKLDGDSQMFDAYMEGKDLYSEIASRAFNMPYEDCLEFNADGTTNKEGKERRSQAKRILLGILYGRGIASIAEQLNCSTERATIIKDSVYRAFPAIKKFENDSLDMAYDLGYVTTICGRKRRLPELYSDDRGKVAQAERQCVNARIQGGAADCSKMALIKISEDKKLKELGLKLLVPIHDEVLCECPEKNMRECSERLSELMSQASQEILRMPMACDVAIYYKWGGEEIDGYIKEIR